MLTNSRLHVAGLAAYLVLTTACPSNPVPYEREPIACEADGWNEVIDQGLLQYVGVAEVASDEPDPDIEGERIVTFDKASGPECLRGDDYQVNLRDGPGDKLLIFMQGGGGCWSDRCIAVETAEGSIYRSGILDPDDPDNPFADWDVLYLPYCDGSVFLGDDRIDDNGDGEVDRIHHGLRNLTAGLDIGRTEFPDPSQIVLAGSSGGGFGTFGGTIMVRNTWPDHPLTVINDAGIGVAKREKPEFINQLISEWNTEAIIPASCDSCFSRGHFIRLAEYSLACDPDVTVGMLSSERDYIIGTLFLLRTGAHFQRSIYEEMPWIHGLYPQRFSPYIVDGSAHTFLLSKETGPGPSIANPEEDGSYMIGGYFDTTVGGVGLRDWLVDMIEGTPPGFVRPDADE